MIIFNYLNFHVWETIFHLYGHTKQKIKEIRQAIGTINRLIFTTMQNNIIQLRTPEHIIKNAISIHLKK